MVIRAFRLAALLLFAALPVLAQTKTPPPPAPEAGAVKQGVHVSGYWKIDVRNPDGTLARHVEFENSLQPGGASLLASLVGNQVTPGPFTVSVNSGLSSTVPCDKDICYLYPSATANYTCQSNATCSNTLVQKTSNGVVSLTGSLTATRAGNIGTVTTVLYVCYDTYTPAACRADFKNSGINAVFTSVDLPSPVTVSSGQLVQVSVALSFS